jgi:hypothetical protein
MPLKDDVAKYITQGKEAVSGYVEAYKDKEKQRKDSKEHEEPEKAGHGEQQQHVIEDKQSSSDTPAASTSAQAQTTEVAKTEDTRPSSALGRYKDRLAIGAPALFMITSPQMTDMMSVRMTRLMFWYHRECHGCTFEHKFESRYIDKCLTCVFEDPLTLLKQSGQFTMTLSSLEKVG